MQRLEKQQFVKNFNTILKENDFLVVTHYKGLTVSEISDLRRKIKSNNATFKVAKNTLAKRAIQQTNFEKLDKFFVGPTSVAYSNDPVTTSKVIVDFSKTNENLKVLAGVMGDQQLSPDDIKQLASLPSMEELRAKIVGLLSSVQTKIVFSLKDSQSKVVRLINSKPRD